MARHTHTVEIKQERIFGRASQRYSKLRNVRPLWQWSYENASASLALDHCKVLLPNNAPSILQASLWKEGLQQE
jgi:hypothetical protein